MKNIFFSVLCFCIIAVSLFSCNEENQPPTCKITAPANASAVTIGNNLTLYVDAEDTDGNITEVRFYINGISMSSVKSPPYSYTWFTGAEIAGLYTLKATSYDDENASASDEVMIELVEAIETPIAAFSATPTTGEAPLEVSFTDVSDNEPESWIWDFGDGGSSAVQNPSHTYAEEGDYTVMLTVSNGSGSDSKTKSNYITVTAGGGNMGAPCPETPIVTDIDGNTYSTALIGDQCWMKKNLKVTHYPNGEAIPYITDNDEWGNLADNNTDDAYCYYDNQTSVDYGALYSFAAAIADNWQKDNTEGQGICPDGWHLPMDDEWTKLSDYLGGRDIAGGKMKDSGTMYWVSPNTGATNESGFTAYPEGYRDCFNGWFINAGNIGGWWSAEENSSSSAWYNYVLYNYADLFRLDYNKSNGISVRCIRDE